MGAVIGEILPFALGIAISPIPIMGVILMLQSPRAKSAGVGFLLGWLLGIIATVVIFELLAAIIPSSDPDAPKPIVGVIQILLGLGLLFLAWKQWKARPRDGVEPVLPKWMAAIDTMTTGRAFTLGFVLAAVNPKNLLLAIGAGVAIGTAGLDVGSQVVVTIVFILIACASVAIPVIAYLLASERMAGPLERLHVWLVQNNATVMAVLLLVIGVVVIGKGIGSF